MHEHPLDLDTLLARLIGQHIADRAQDRARVRQGLGRIAPDLGQRGPQRLGHRGAAMGVDQRPAFAQKAVHRRKRAQARHQ